MNTPAASQPPIVRGSMKPRSWAGHPVMRMFRAVFGRGSPDRTYPLTPPRPFMWRRLILLTLVLVGAGYGTTTMVELLPNHGGTTLEQGILILFGVLFAWISAGFWTAIFGVWVLMRGTDASSLDRALPEGAADGPIDASARTAIIMPICNEEVASVFANLRATFESLRETGHVGLFDVFVLSDTYKPELRVAEQAAFSQLRSTLGVDVHVVDADDNAGTDSKSGGNLYYRWRQHRTKRKAGNVADFCRRWGRDYRYMVVLDADSVMTGECIAHLVRLMEAHPDAGIIQTAPRACGHSTLHGRALQFGSRVYGPLFTAGMYFWQLGESHYWGHNAILRLEPFMRYCSLPPLPGTGAMGGEVMSHDFVEASLIRRAGYKVWVAHDLPGSFEQVPPNLVSELQRDQRWCLGNLQNARLMFEPGLHPVHRSVFLTGVLAYISAPMWLGFLLLSTLLFARQMPVIPQYFMMPYQLFPIWPTSNFELMLALFGMTAVLLIGPKALSILVLILKGQAHEYGGAMRLVIGAILEFTYSVFLAPVRMLFHTQFVLAPLFGSHGGWTSPPRGDDATPWSQALRVHGLHTVLCIAWIAAIVATSVSGNFPWSLSPVFAGLLIGAPLSVWGSRASIGRALRRVGLLQTPEEREEPMVLQRAGQYADEAPPSAEFVQAVSDPRVRSQVLASVPMRAPAQGDKAKARDALVDKALHEGPDALAANERLRLLSDGESLSQLADRSRDASTHASWRLPADAAASAVLEAEQALDKARAAAQWRTTASAQAPAAMGPAPAH